VLRRLSWRPHAAASAVSLAFTDVHGIETRRPSCVVWSYLHHVRHAEATDVTWAALIYCSPIYLGIQPPRSLSTQKSLHISRKNSIQRFNDRPPLYRMFQNLGLLGMLGHSLTLTCCPTVISTSKVPQLTSAANFHRCYQTLQRVEALHR